MLTLTLKSYDGVILHLESAPYWTWQDYFDELCAVKPTLVTPQRIDVIFSIEEGTGVAPGFIHSAAQSDEIVSGITVMIGGGGYLESALGLLKVVDKARGNRYYTATNMADARALIQNDRTLSVLDPGA
jgi:hypothetical protein